jgi:hypothetical protein
MSLFAASWRRGRLRLVTKLASTSKLHRRLAGMLGGFDYRAVPLLASILTTGSEWRSSYLMWSPTNQEG